MTEDEMVGWHHRLNGHEFEQTPGVGDRQGSLMCCGPWGPKEPDTTEPLDWTELGPIIICCPVLGSIPGLYPLDGGRASCFSCDNQNVPG